ncbi:hypothetical protein ONZ45_g19700 [Pleurotus djamor]|nr:hypothetical protein ONZ45_g19700 [Pleurotus djamor]
MVSTFIASVTEAQAALPYLVRFWEFSPPFPLERLGELCDPNLFKGIPRVPQKPMTYATNGISLKYTPFRAMAHDSFVHTPKSVHFAVLPTASSSLKSASIALLVEEYRSTFAQVGNINDGITQLDLQFNDLHQVLIADVPAFVKTFQDEIASETLLSPFTLSSVVNGNTTHVHEPLTGQNGDVRRSQDSDHRRQSLLYHIDYLRRDFQNFWRVQADNPLKTHLAHSMFFDALAASIPESSSVVPSANQPWPFRLVVVQATSPPLLPSQELRSYEPHNDFLLQRSGLPYFIVEIDSGSSALNYFEHPDFIRPLIQGASLVRLANQHLEPFKREKTFILVCVFVCNTGETNWLTLFQNPGQGNRVFYTHEKGSLDTFPGRAKFALRLYNLLNKIDIEKSEEDMDRESWLQGFQLKTELLPALTSKQPSSKHPRPSAGWATDTSSEKSSSHGSGPTTEDALQASNDLGFLGYEIIPDHILATDGTDFDTIDPLPKHLFTVFQPSFPHTRYVAKKIYKDSDEIKILQFLNSLSPSCQNIIPLSNTFTIVLNTSQRTPLRSV